MMNKLLLILLITLVVYSASASAQTSPAAPVNKQATPATTPASPALSGAQPAVAREEDCACEAQPLPDVLATVNAVRITGKDISEQTAQRVAGLHKQVVEARRRELELQINSRLLNAEAKKRGTTAPKLLEAEVISKVKDPTDAEVQAFYDQNKSNIGAELKDVRSDIIAYLRNKKEGDESQKYAASLRAVAQVKVLMPNAAPPTSAAERARVLATVNGEQITSGDIENSLRPLIFNVQEQVYALRRRDVDLKINDTLLEQEAQKRKVTTSALLDAEVTAKSKPVTEAEARSFYDQNKERVNGEYEALKAQLISYLQERQARDAQLAFAEQLRRAAVIQTFLTPPEPPVYDIATDDQPSQGSQSAPVTIVEFTDYQCPVCAAAQPSIERLMKEYEGKARLVVRDFPLEQHANAYQAALAAEAAREQGKYWEYVALLLRNQAKLETPALKEYASQLALDRQKFDAALDSGKFSDQVQRDVRDALRLGVNGTPTIYVNGRRVSENTYESLKAAIDAALKAPSKK
jgi:protein-disulfide isomerase